MLVAVSALTAPFPVAATAEESAMPTTQARAYNADWVPYLDPPEKPAAVCLVDSGVDITPDTPPDSPDGPIVKRLSLDGGPGTAANSTWEGGHGTRMAFVGAAPVNGWGTVGFWPGARIVSIRAMPPGGTSFPFDYYSKAVDLCNKWATSERVVAINLSLGCLCAPGPDEAARLENQVAAAHANNQSVVAAAGNRAGSIGSPANEPGILAVAAGDRANALCLLSNRGDGVDLVAPGCDVDLANPASGQLWSDYQSGTSGASITTSVVLALLRSYSPSLSWQTAEELTTASARPTVSGQILDVEALFDAAGLGALVDAAKARARAFAERSEEAVRAPTGSGIGSVAGPDDVVNVSVKSEHPVLHRLVEPRVKRLIKRAGRLTVSVRNLPFGARLLLTLQSRRGEFVYTTVLRATSSASHISLRLPRRWRGGRVVLRYQLVAPPQSTSSSVYRGVSR